MIKYEIIQNRAKFYSGIRYKIVSGCTLDSFEFEPAVIRSYDTKAQALAEFDKLTARIEKMGIGIGTYYMVTEYYLQKNKYDNNGNWIDCLKIYKFSPINIKIIEINSSDIIGTFNNFADAEKVMVDLMIKNPHNDYGLILPDEIYY